jgi:ATP-dependent DNA helicase RecQ
MLEQKVLEKYWGHKQFRPQQLEIIQSVLTKHDTLAILPTGGGKSICFQVPALILEGICIVICPLIALMKDQVEQLKKRGINAYAIFSGMSEREIDITLDNCIYGKTKFLYLSPERLKSELVQARIAKMHVNLLVIDEAHCISQWGHDFRPSYLEIASIKKILPQVNTIALTASATPKTQRDIIANLDLNSPQIFIKSFARNNLSYSSIYAEDKEQTLVRLIKKMQGHSMVYVRSRKKTKELALLLYKHGISVDFYHAGLSTEERTSKQNRWMSGQIHTIVCTNAFGMGIDKADVRLVIHYDLPDSMEAYYQEAGRAGRDEQKAFAVLLYQHHDGNELIKNVELAYPDLEFLKRVYQSLANYYKIAIGSSEMIPYDFNITDFENTYNLPSRQTYFAIKQLEKEGLVLMNETFYAPSVLHFNISDKEELYKFQVANAKFDPLIKVLLRFYGGELFVHFIKINEAAIATQLVKSESDIVNMLLYLDKSGLVTYIPKRDKPQITFVVSRLDAAKLPINPKKYLERKNNELEKVQAIIHYTQNKTICRSNLIQTYFGEKNIENCGICDICMKSKLTSAQVITKLETCTPITIDNFLNQYSESERKIASNILRELIDEKKIRYNNGTLTLL